MKYKLEGIDFHIDLYTADETDMYRVFNVVLFLPQHYQSVFRIHPIIGECLYFGNNCRAKNL
jgi:hypothetical protein